MVPLYGATGLRLCLCALFGLILLLATYAAAEADRGTDKEALVNADGYLLRNNTFLFISGWPQSGTSLVNQILTIAPYISTMVNRCNQLIGEKCLNWNHEGQWLMPPLSGQRDIFLNSGSMCRGSRAFDGTDQRSQVFSEALISAWAKYWDLSSAILVEKSPQSILKSTLLRGVFKRAKAVKFIIVIKHPATLNTATKKDTTWMTRTLKDPAGQITGTTSLDAAGILANAEYFTSFLKHDGSNNGTASQASDTRCSLGWLDTMNYLFKQLSTNAASYTDTRIIRYEYFEMPNKLCRALLRFLFDVDNPTEQQLFHYNIVVSKVCDIVFNTKSKSASAPKRGSRTEFMNRFRQGHRRLRSDNSSVASWSSYDGTNRGLRLRSASDNRFRDRQIAAGGAFSNAGANSAVEATTALVSNTVDFQLQVVRSSRLQRFGEFKHMLEELDSIRSPPSKSVQDKLTSTLLELEKFGYGGKSFETFSGGKDVLSRWDIMRREGSV
jgi:hypothetical protein